MIPLDSAIPTNSYPPALPSSAWAGSTLSLPAQSPSPVQPGSDAIASAGTPAQTSAAPPLPHAASTPGDRSAEKLLSRHFGQTLKNTGIKAEIHIEQGVGMIVRLVQSDTGKVVMQLPPQGVIDLVAEIQQKQDQEMKIDDPETRGASEASGSSAESAQPASGGLIDAMA